MTQEKRGISPNKFEPPLQVRRVYDINLESARNDIINMSIDNETDPINSKINDEQRDKIINSLASNSHFNRPKNPPPTIPSNSQQTQPPNDPPSGLENPIPAIVNHHTNNNNLRNSRYFYNQTFNQPLTMTRSLTFADILNLTHTIPTFDSTAESFEIFQRRLIAASRTLNITDQRILISQLMNKFSGPVVTWIYHKLENYPNIDTLIEDLREHFVPKSSLDILETQIQTIVQEQNESVRDYGARMSFLYEKIKQRIANDNIMTANQKRDKAQEVDRKIKKQLLTGLQNQLFIQTTNRDFKDMNLDAIIEQIKLIEWKNKKHDSCEQYRSSNIDRRVNFESSVNSVETDPVSNTDILKAISELTVAISNISTSLVNKSPPRNEIQPREQRYSRRDYSRDRYDQTYRKNRDWSRDSSRNRSYSRERGRKYNNQRDNVSERNQRRYTSRSRDNSRNNSYDRKRYFSPGSRDRNNSRDSRDYRRRSRSRDNYENYGDNRKN